MERNNNLKDVFFEKKRYPALRTVAGIYVIYAIILGFLTFFITLYLLSKEYYLYSLYVFIGGSLFVLLVLAISESIKVLLDIEYNTRSALWPIISERERQKQKAKEVEINKDDFISENVDEISIVVKEPDKVEKLNSLIKSQKGKIFGGKTKDKIIEITKELCESKEYAEDLLLYYKTHFNKDLLNELKSLTTSYEGIKDYLRPFIELGIVKEEYPHDRI